MIAEHKTGHTGSQKSSIVCLLLLLICVAFLAGALQTPVTSFAAQRTTAARATNEDRNSTSHSLSAPYAPPGRVPGEHSQVNNQFYQGRSDNGNNSMLTGANQGNSGNQGINRGLNQDNDSNRGNQVSGQRKNIATQVNNQFQHLQGSNGNGNSTNLVGINQGNSGNEGTNLGHNQDNSGNSGNQVNNQGNVIGTQINNQGSSVSNQGNVIKKQINYVNLLPGVQLSLSLRPKLQFGLNVGK